MSDLLRDCNSGELKTDSKAFQGIWCARCSHKGCDLAVFANMDPMAVRNATWEERFFGAPQADLSIPKFAEIARQDFPNLLQKAMRLEISDRRGDWSVPEVPVIDGQPQLMTPNTETHVDLAVQQLAQRNIPPEPPAEEPFLGYEEPEESLDLEPEVDEPEVSMPLAPRVILPQPEGRNTFDPGEIMVGGDPAPSDSSREAPPLEVDPWAPKSAPAITIVKSGARIQFGSSGKGKVVDE